MGNRIKRCPFCKVSIDKTFKKNGKTYKFIRMHSNNVKTKSIKSTETRKLNASQKVFTNRFDIKKYKCVNYKEHGWIKNSDYDFEWYYVIFDDKPIHNNKRYYYQESKLYHADDFIKTCRELTKIEYDDEILKEIIQLENTHPIYLYLKSNVPTLFDNNTDELEVPMEIGSKNFQILLFYLKGFSQELIAEIFNYNSRTSVSMIIKDFMGKNKINFKNLTLNCSVVYRKKDKKIIESKYYNKYDAKDFHYIN